jgi:glyceraldehyde 3-phosphate dehydrogenase
MIVKLAINGLGRIGRLVLRQLMDRPDVEIVAVNDIADTRTLAHLIKHDSVHGRASFPVSNDGDSLLLGGRRIPVHHEKMPGAAPFGEAGAQIVLECTGLFTKRAQAALHLKGSVSHVVISAPSDDADFTAVMGVNHEKLDTKAHRIISNASCTTNCLAPMVKVLDDAFGIEYGLITTVHAYTNDQRILDLPHKDLRRARAASMSMIPTSTGAAKAIGLVLPHLAGRLDGIAVRVPTPDVSLTDLSVMVAREATVEAINDAFRKAAGNGYLEVLDEELVSVDLRGNPASCIFDPFLTKAMTPRYVKVFGWYDNEFGYAARMKDLAIHVLERIKEGVR